jgi:hypothetical protein
VPPTMCDLRGTDEVALFVARLAERGWARARLEVLEPEGISVREYRAIEILSGWVDGVEVAAGGDLAQAVEELAARRLVFVSHEPAPAVRIELSQDGLKLWERLAQTVLAARAREFDGIPLADLHQLSRILSWVERRNSDSAP